MPSLLYCTRFRGEKLRINSLTIPPSTARREAEAKKGAAGSTPSHLDEPLVENLNRLQVEDSARSVGEAIQVLGGKPSKEDKHPEKRLQAAYKAFEERMMPRLVFLVSIIEATITTSTITQGVEC